MRGAQKFLAAEMLMQVNAPEIKQAVEPAIRGQKKGQTKADTLINWVYDSLEKKPVVSVPNAVQILKSREGDCNEQQPRGDVTACCRCSCKNSQRLGVFRRPVFISRLGRILRRHALDIGRSDLGTRQGRCWSRSFFIGGLERQLALIQIVGNLRLEYIKWE